MSDTANVSGLLKQRGIKYGDFLLRARIAQALMDIVARTPGWQDMQPDQRQALVEIFGKVARMCNGDPHYPENWVDIEGYARLVRVRLEEEGPVQSGTAPTSLGVLPKLLRKFEEQTTQPSEASQ